MEANRTISIIVPVFNEEDSIGPLYGEIRAAVERVPRSSYEIVFVDDGSEDSSVRVCRQLCASDPEHVRLVALRRNFGQTAAMAAGFDHASGDLIIPIDADMQNDPADIPRLIEKIDEGYDVVSGWRADRQDKFITRKIPSLIANRLISRITFVRLHDYGCTLKAYRRDVVEHMRLYGELHRFLPVLASWAGARVTEIQVNHRPRKFGKSKYGLGRTRRVLLDLVTVKFLSDYSTKPMQIFGKWGIWAFAASGGFMLLALFLKFFYGMDFTDNPWLYLSIFCGLTGVQLIGLGLLSELSVRTYYESQQKRIYTVREVVNTAPPGENSHT
ncbi:MAG: glycosyltransferase [Candidatus Hydrogenedentota bacterium]